MTDSSGTGSTRAKHDWHSELLRCFRQASAAEGTGTADAELLAAIVGDLADCSARECVTFLLPALDRHGGRPAEEACWSPADAAVLRGLTVALPHVRPRQRVRTLAICLEALLRRLAAAALADAQHEDPAAVRTEVSSPAPRGDDVGAAEHSAGQRAGSDIAGDVPGFVLHAAEQLRDDSVTDAAALANAVSGECVRFVRLALATLAQLSATLQQPDRSVATSDSGGRSYSDQGTPGKPLKEAYDPYEPTAASLLRTLPQLGCSSTEDLRATVSGPSADEPDDGEHYEGQALSSLGQAAAVHAALCCPNVVVLRLPDDPDSRLSLALNATQARDGCCPVLRSVLRHYIPPCR